MLRTRSCIIRASVTLVCLASQQVLAAGGTSIIAQKGQPVHVASSWPEGVAELVNDPARTTGWNSWFTEWPNDVNQYVFAIASADDVNRLIKKLAATKSQLRQVRLSYLKEPRALGWVTQLPEGNKIPVIFSIGDQARIDQWYKHVRKPFGKMVFVATPVAVPPTLTIFVQNEAIDLDKLKIPDGVELSAGYCPTLFHRSNTTIEKKREQEKSASRPVVDKSKLDASSRKAVEQISEFLKKQDVDR